MSSVDLDNLECVAILLERGTWEIFKEMCECHGIRNARRIEALWAGWVGEDFIPEWMNQSLRLIITKTTWNEEAKP